ncbi:MAG: antibiotic biosynthesis monooxygenase [Elusimicrobia bacterium]|nr:antibiotic biosynthesis monooxygenase [Elusimicrobiota bacterium]
MFVAVYRWKLKKGKEVQFRKAWSAVTLALRQNHGSLGSRLHQAEDGTWAAYAQWPDKKSWGTPHPLDEAGQAARLAMRDAVEDKFPDLYLTVTDDFLLPAS